MRCNLLKLLSIFLTCSMCAPASGGGWKYCKVSWYPRGPRGTNPYHTVAHRTLPKGTWIEIENVDRHSPLRGRRKLAKVGDRGPKKWTGRDLDAVLLTYRGFDLPSRGVCDVRYRVWRGRPPLPTSAKKS